MSQTKKHYSEFLIIDIWVALFFLGIGLAYVIFCFNTAISQERRAVFYEEQSLYQGKKLSEYSDYLTNWVRMFVITGDPKYLQQYWTEVIIDQHRDRVIASLDSLGMPKNEQDLLFMAKKNSDALVQTETMAMKLVIIAMGIPESRMSIALRREHLPIRTMTLSSIEKINLAQRIMFDQTYADNKKTIMTPIDQFLDDMQRRLTQEILNERQKVDRLFIMIVVITALMLTLLLSIIWLKNAILLTNKGDNVIFPY